MGQRPSVLCFRGALLAQTLLGLNLFCSSWQSPSQDWMTSSGQSWPAWARWLSQGAMRQFLTLFLPTDRSMSSSLSASQLHTVSMRDPLNRVLGKVGMGPWGHIQPLDTSGEFRPPAAFPEVT